MDNRDTIRIKLLKKAKDQINQKMAGREIHIIKAVNLLSDLDSVNNLLNENASEWLARQPAGEAKEAYTELTKNSASIEEEKKSLSEFIENEMKEEFPNFSILATPIIGAKLLASAGSKKRLAFMAASTIQVLGAEKALFAHMRKDASSPKHGHLFNHPLLQKLSRTKRGKAARVIAGKLAIALKQDYFNGENTSKTALKELEEKIMEISNKIEVERPAKAQDTITQPKESNYPKADFSKRIVNSDDRPRNNFNRTDRPQRDFGRGERVRRDFNKPQGAQRDFLGEKTSRRDYPRSKNIMPSYGNKEASARSYFGSEGRSFSSKPSYGNKFSKDAGPRGFEGKKDRGPRGNSFSKRKNPFGPNQNRTRDSETSNFGQGRNKNSSFGKGRFNKPKHSFKKF